MRILICVVCYSLISILATAQFPGDNQYQGNTYLRLNPLGLVDVTDANLTIGAEFELPGRWSFAQDIGWVMYSLYIPSNQRANGLLIRPAIRYYFSDTRNGFIEMELHYKYVNYLVEDWIGKNCVNNVPAYEELTQFNIRKHTAGVHLKLGTRFDLAGNKRWLLESYTGFGIRYKAHSTNLDDQSCYSIGQKERGINLVTIVKGFAPVFPLGMKLLYRIN